MTTPSDPAAAALPPIRACLFDMDGLLLNTEDIYTRCANAVLRRHGKPDLPWEVKAGMMGVPGSSNGPFFHAWARLPIPPEQYAAEQREQQLLLFPECEPLPGVEALLRHLASGAARTVGRREGSDGNDGNDGNDLPPVGFALASSSARANYEMKTSQPRTRAVMEQIPAAHRVLGDDPRVRAGRGKPAPDIYLCALAAVNATRPPGSPAIAPAECLVFEDSVVGVEAGRRAGMRVAWVPHERIADIYRGREEEVLAGRVGLVPVGGGGGGDDDDGSGSGSGSEKLGSPGDGWARQLASLEDFPYEYYGITAPAQE